jgi:Flagellar capping protein
MSTSIDPTTYAQTLVSAERAGRDAILSKKATAVKTQLSGISTLSSSLSTFQTLLTKLNKVSTMQAQSATLSDSDYFTATTDGTAAVGQYNLKVKQLAQSQQTTVALADTSLTETSTFATGGTFTITLGSGSSQETMTLNVAAGSTVKQLVSAINSNSDNPGVRASLVRTDGQLSLLLNGKETGSENSFTVASSGLSSVLGSSTNITDAQDAIVELGTTSPISITSASNKLTGVISGVTLQLTKAQDSSDTPVTVTVAEDTSAVASSVQEFVDGYNTLMKGLKTLVSNGDTKGNLAGDSMVNSLISQMRSTLRSLPSGTTLSSLGISSDKDGLLSLDSSDLKSALEDDPELVGNALTGTNGMLTKMKKMTENYTKLTGTIKQRKTALELQQTSISDQQDAFDTRMEKLYQRYLKQFTQLSSYMSQMEQTSSLF